MEKAMQRLFWLVLISAASVSRAQEAPPAKVKLLALDEVGTDLINPGDEGTWWRGESSIGGDSIVCHFVVLQVVDENNLLVKERGLVWWLEMPTKGIVDDIELDLSRKVFSFVGTKRYETTLGVKTVFHLKYVRDYVPPPPPAPVPVKTAPKPKFAGRVWTDDTGKHSVTAELAGFENGKVILRKEDGKELRISPERLSAKDVKWYRDALRERNKEIDRAFRLAR